MLIEIACVSCFHMYARQLVLSAIQISVDILLLCASRFCRAPLTSVFDSTQDSNYNMPDFYWTLTVDIVIFIILD